MRIRSLLAASLAALLIFSSCDRNAVVLSYTNARGEVPQLQNLVFRFNHSLIKDSMLNNWDSTDYISFEPAIRGRFRWDSPDELVFSPLEPLKPATSYKATIHKSVLHFSKYDNVSGDDKIDFHTAALTLDNSQITWVGESSSNAVPQLDLLFNYKVDPAALKDRMKLEVAGAEMDYSLISQSPSDRITLRVNGMKMEDKDLDSKLTIDKGLKPENGTNSTTEIIRSELSIPSPFVLNIQNLQSEHDGMEGVITVSTSQQVVADNLKSYIKLSPDVPFSVQATENGFQIRSDKFDAEQSYTVSINTNLRGKIGGVLKESYSGDVAFGELESNIAFTNNKAVYLSKNGSKNVEVQLTNVDRVKLVVSKIYANNLLMAQRYGYYPSEASSDNMSDYEGDYASYDEGGDAMLGDVIYEKEIDVRSLPKSGVGRLLNFSQFEDRLPDFNGIYHIMIRSTEDYWVRDSRFISLSDLGLIAKEGKDKMYVFTNSIKSAQPVSGVNISLYSINNQLIGTASTNAEGVAEVPYTQKDFPGFKPAMIIAKTADDFNYLPFNNTRVNTSRFDVGGKRDNPSGLDAFVYAERDIYRPGEKINLAVVVRDKQWKAPGDVPLKLKFLLPNGKELKSLRKSLNDEGATEANLDISPAAITGSYTLEVYTSNDVLLASRNFSVEEFVPDRIRVNTKLDRAFARPGEATTLAINAMNFFGPPAANRNYEAEIQVKQRNFSPAKFGDYDFTLANQKGFFDKIVKEGKTDPSGNAAESYAVPADYANTGLLQANFYTTVFDETGRPVSRAASLDIYTQDVFFGVKNNWNYYFPLNQAVKFELAAVNREGNATSGQAHIQVIKHEYNTVLRKSGSYFRYESQKNDKLMSESNMTIANNTPITYIPRSPGDYELRVFVPGANNYVSRSFYSYGSWGGNNNSFEVNTEGNIDIELDKKSYSVGEKIKAHFKTPFSGKMLVTTETDHVVSYKYLDVSNRDASLDLDVTADDIPNVYITATLFKPHDVSDIPLTVAHGFQNVQVDEKGRKIDVAIAAAKTVRSKTTQKVTVKAAPGSYVTLAAVDNGVLQVTDFKTPNPYDYFYQKKALQVSAFDLYPLLFAEVRARLSSTGGDADLEMNKRINPIQAKRVNVVSYWSGMQKANGSGEVQFEVPVPAFSGELRLMAVAYKGSSFGGAENTMTVADPVVISTALPRFLSPGDTIVVPVTLSNTTAKAASVTASVVTDGPIKLVNGSAQQVTLSANSEGRAQFSVVAASSIGVAHVKVQVSGMGEKFDDITEIAVRPPSTLQKMSGSGTVDGGQAKHINIATSDFMPGSTDYSLVVSRSPVLNYAEQLRYLVQYPFGCTEQTVSSAFPQLYYGDMADLMQLNKQNRTTANNNVMEAIRKIKMRQLYNGAVTLWDGEDKEDWWTTVYAAHFLLEAKKAGFDVDASLLETMLNYLSNRLKNKQTITYYYNRDQNRKIAPKEVSYSLYVLALANRANVPAMNYYKANPSLLALDSRYLLSAAYAIAGDRRSFSAMLPAAFAGEQSVPQTGGSYYSPVRDEAIALNALLEVDPGNAQVNSMANHIADQLKSSNYLNTQERAFSFLALGKLARSANNSTATADIVVNGKVVAHVSGGQWQGDMAALKSASVDIQTKGSGKLYYFWQSEGVSTSGAYKEEDSYLKVRKRFYDRFGHPLTGNSFHQNDLIIVGITLEKSFNTPVENVVITDLLPAGFEIENPRTKEIPGMDWIKDQSEPTALDVRDDRIHFFVDATSNRQTYYYAVRAVSPGQYRMGPVSADAMYRGEYHSYNGAGTIRIQQ